MEVYVLRKIPDDGVKEEYFKDVKSLYSWRGFDVTYLHIVDTFEEGCFLDDVIKFEVY